MSKRIGFNLKPRIKKKVGQNVGRSRTAGRMISKMKFGFGRK